MAAGHADTSGLTRARSATRPAVGVLAERLAAALVHHEPGWRLPRHTALARRYNVSAAEIDAALEELASRHLIRRLADGQVYRASPAEYLIPLEGVSGLESFIDPMSGEIACQSRQVSWRRVPEDIGWALEVTGPEPICVVRFLWTAGGEPAALSTTYLAGELGAQLNGQTGSGLPATLSLLPLAAPAESGADRADFVPAGRPSSLHIEMQQPPPAVARSLRLSVGQPAAIVTVRFDDPAGARPVALTVAVLRPDLFRVVVQTGDPPLPGCEQHPPSGAWAHAMEDWES